MAKRVPKTIGRAEKVDLPVFNVENINAKIDTGAHRSSLHCKGIRRDGDSLKFKVLTDNGYQQFVADNWTQKKIRSSNGKAELRYVIKTKLGIFGKIYTVSFSLTDRSKMKYPVLIGRKFLQDRFIVDVSKKNLSYKEKIQ